MIIKSNNLDNKPQKIIFISLKKITTTVLPRFQVSKGSMFRILKFLKTQNVVEKYSKNGVHLREDFYEVLFPNEEAIQC